MLPPNTAYRMWLCPVCKQYQSVGTTHQHENGTWMNEMLAKDVEMNIFRKEVLKKLNEIVELLKCEKTS